jgi:hypothetical protein
MTRPSPPRLVAAALLIVAGIALSLALGAPTAATLLALFAGAGAALLGIPAPPPRRRSLPNRNASRAAPASATFWRRSPNPCSSSRPAGRARQRRRAHRARRRHRG